MKRWVLLFSMILCVWTSPAQAKAPVIQGHWTVNAVLTATSVPNHHVKEGHRKVENWQIRQNGNTATLTTPNGSINGRFLPSTREFPKGVWYFHAMVERFMNQPNLALKIEIVVVKRSPNVLGGGTTATYMGNNSFGGPWVPMGIESWRFDGKRSR